MDFITYIYLIMIMICVASTTKPNKKNRLQNSTDTQKGGRGNKVPTQTQFPPVNIIPEVPVFNQDIVFLLGGNGTILKCNLYQEQGMIPLLSDQDRNKLSILDVEVGTSGTKSKSGIVSKIPFKYVVCDTSSTGSGIIVSSLGYPFLALGAEAFKKAFSDAKYIPYPCDDDLGFFKKMERWAMASNIAFSSAFIGRLDDQLFFNNTASIVTIVIVALFAVGVAVWMAYIIKRIVRNKSSNVVFMPSGRVISEYPKMSQKSSVQLPSFSQYGPSDGQEMQRLSHSDSMEFSAGRLGIPPRVNMATLPECHTEIDESIYYND